MTSNEFEKEDTGTQQAEFEKVETQERENSSESSLHTHNEMEPPSVNTENQKQDANDTFTTLSDTYAGFWMRFWAYLLDLIVIGSISRMIIHPTFRAMDLPLSESEIFSPMAIATAFVFYLYFVLMTKFFGQTLGKMVFGLKVVDLNGKKLSWGTVIFREWIGRFISATILFLYIVVAFSQKKQGLHDMFADTTVIIEPR